MTKTMIALSLISKARLNDVCAFEARKHVAVSCISALRLPPAALDSSTCVSPSRAIVADCQITEVRHPGRIGCIVFVQLSGGAKLRGLRLRLERKWQRRESPRAIQGVRSCTRSRQPLNFARSYVLFSVNGCRSRHGKVQYRVLYFFHGRHVAILTHGLVKEKEVPEGDVERAIERKLRFEKAPAKHTYREGDRNGKDN